MSAFKGRNNKKLIHVAFIYILLWILYLFGYLTKRKQVFVSLYLNKVTQYKLVTLFENKKKRTKLQINDLRDWSHFLLFFELKIANRFKHGTDDT